MPFGWPFHTTQALANNSNNVGGDSIRGRVSSNMAQSAIFGPSEAIEGNPNSHHANNAPIESAMVAGTALSAIVEEDSILEERTHEAVDEEGVYTYDELNNSRHAQDAT